ncbi:MAG: hypothetical protein U1F87_15545 [Kiritimatiellia bacterium]
MKKTAILLSLLAATVSAQAQSVVFDTTGGAVFSALTTANNQRYADDAKLANASGETIGQIDISVLLQEDNTTADVYAYLFDATGTGGSPGASPLWSSSVLAYDFTAFEDVVSFAVPNIAVPQNFFWAVEFRNIVKLDDGTPVPSSIFGPQMYRPPRPAGGASTSPPPPSIWTRTRRTGPAPDSARSTSSARTPPSPSRSTTPSPEPLAASLLTWGRGHRAAAAPSPTAP